MRLSDWRCPMDNTVNFRVFFLRLTPMSTAEIQKDADASIDVRPRISSCWRKDNAESVRK